MSVAGVMVGTSPDHGEGPGSSPRAALQFHPKEILVRPIPFIVAKQICIRHHYLHSCPPALFTFGLFVESLFLGVVVVGVGPFNLSSFFERAARGQVLCLSRLWLDDRLSHNSESRVLGILLRSLRRHQHTVKAVVAYSDPGAGHDGSIYRAAGFLFLGKSDATPLYKLPGRGATHSRTLSATFGTRSGAYFASQGIKLELIPQMPKLTYVALIDPSWRAKLIRAPHPYPRKEIASAYC